jgi:DNA-binding MarR family transcriptional regulator
MSLDNKARELAGYFHAVRERMHVAEKSNPATAQVMNLQEAHTLLNMGAKGPMTMSEIAATLQLSLSSVTTIVDKLEGKRLVRRDRSGTDRRIVRVELTPEGAKFHSLIEKSHLRLTRDFLNSLKAQEQDLLLELFRKMTATFKSGKAGR